MTTRNPAPPLPQPQPPAVAARALRDAAKAAARAWARPTGPAGEARAVSQIHSALRDLGIATGGLAGYHTAGNLPGATSSKFARDVTAGARWLLDAWQHLDGVLAAEGMPRPPDDTDPGAALCQAARNLILAWRHPEGTAADRDTTVGHLITSAGFLATAALSLAAYAPRHRTIELRAVAKSLAEAGACLTRAVSRTADDNIPGQNIAPAPHQAAGQPGAQAAVPAGQRDDTPGRTARSPQDEQTRRRTGGRS